MNDHYYLKIDGSRMEEDERSRLLVL